MAERAKEFPAVPTLKDQAEGSFPRGKLGEPWVDLPNGEALAAWGREDEISFNQMNRQIGKYQFFVGAYDFITDNRVAGDYFEFGCHRARTFRMSLTEARRHRLDNMKFYAFDSFEGLPPTTSNPSNDLWQRPGVLTTSEEEFLRLTTEHGIYPENIKTVKGFFADSLTTTLSAKLKDAGSKIAMACVDCDLYESAQPVFSFIEPFLQEGSLIYIDDLWCGYKGSPQKGVARAFVEFQRTSQFKFAPHMNVGWWGRSYIAYRADPALGEWPGQGAIL